LRAIIPTLCAASLLLATSAHAQNKRDAQQHVERATALYIQKQYAEAIVEFQLACSLTPDPLILYNIGICYQALGDDARAQEVLQEVATHPDAQPKEVTSSLARLLAISTHAKELAKSAAQTEELTIVEPPPPTPTLDATPTWYSVVMWSSLGLGLAATTTALVLNAQLGTSIDAYEADRRQGRATDNQLQSIQSTQLAGKISLFAASASFSPPQVSTSVTSSACTLLPRRTRTRTLATSHLRSWPRRPRTLHLAR
jgi:tetratricopeptide (TPR) repeat protein